VMVRYGSRVPDDSEQSADDADSTVDTDTAIGEPRAAGICDLPHPEQNAAPSGNLRRRTLRMKRQFRPPYASMSSQPTGLAGKLLREQHPRRTGAFDVIDPRIVAADEVHARVGHAEPHLLVLEVVPQMVLLDPAPNGVLGTYGMWAT